MNRREFMASAATAALAGRLVSGQDNRKKPNVILIMPDDQGYGDLACHGNPVIQTPSLDRLHAQSTRLTDFHVDPLCSPTRAALMTGRYSARVGVWATTIGRSLLRRDEATMADVFAASGYRTGAFGKWHMGDNYPFRPQDRGFQETLVHGGGGVGQTPDCWGNDYFDDTYYRNGKPEKFSGYCTDVFFDGARKFIEANRTQPFFCYIAPNAPHGPYRVDRKYSKPYRSKGVKSPTAEFYGMITNIDENIGRLARQLKELGLEDSTILVFITDNGTSAGGYGAGLRGRKGAAFEGGHRVPCFIRWPGKLEAGRDVGRLAAHLDLLPTFIELGGLKRPDGVKFDGASLAPLLTGARRWPDRTLIVQTQQVYTPRKWRSSAVMTQRWRLVNGAALYDITADPGQKKNVAGQQPKVVTRLRRAYEDWWTDVSRRFDEVCPIVIGAEEENPARLTAFDWHGFGSPGGIPWNQGHVRNGRLFANGWWAVEVARDGNYAITLRRFPTEAGRPIGATMARLKIGSLDDTKPIPKGAAHVTFNVKLKTGETRLQTWLADEKTGKSRGAYFVYVKRS